MFQSFRDHAQALGWAFGEYRKHADILGDESFENLAQHRAIWAQHVLPLPGRPQPRTERRDGWEPEEALIVEGNARLDAVVPAANDASYMAARRRYRRASRYFTRTYPWQTQRVLGYGGNGIAIHYMFPAGAGQGAARIPFVVKISMRGWESHSIRNEERLTRKMRRAAHSIQMVRRAQVGVAPQRQWVYDIPPYDDSSIAGNSSGEASRDNNPSPAALERRPRRAIITTPEHAQKLVDYRSATGSARLLTVVRAIRMMLENARRRMVNPPPPLPDRFDIYRKDFVLLEFCENRDMQSLIVKLSTRHDDCPNRVLWSFWLCLVRACVGMEYPPRKFHPRRRLARIPDVNAHPGVDISEAGKIVGNDLFEDIPRARRRWARRRFVHFDIDPQNIFIGGVDVNAKDDEHKIIPRLKLADFGLADEVKSRKRNVYYLNRRDRGKWGSFAPEQFGVHWDHITMTGANGPEVSEETIAGNYGTHTNIFQIAMVLWQVITKYECPVPPQLQRRDAGNNIEAHYCPLLLTDPAYSRVDIELRRTLARCMSYNPRNRPRVTTLLPAALAGINKRFDGETDEFIRDWVNDYIYTP